MGVEVRRGISLLAPLLIVLLLAHVRRVAPHSLVRTNSSTSEGGPPDQRGWLVGDMAMAKEGEEEFFMHSEMNRRMLQGSSCSNNHVAVKATCSKDPAKSCGQGNSYPSCFGTKHSLGNIGQKCDGPNYNRNCHQFR